jgi:hypothetical protein
MSIDLAKIVNAVASVFNVNTAAVNAQQQTASSAPTGGVALLMQIPGAADAVNYIRQQLVKLQQVPARIQALDQGRLQLQQIATAKGQSAALIDLNALGASLPSMRDQYTATAQQLAGVLLDLNAAGFAAVPVALAASAIQAAANMAQLFGRVTDREKLLGNIAGRMGVPLPAGAVASSPGDWKQWALYGGLGLLGFSALKKSRGSRTW